MPRFSESELDAITATFIRQPFVEWEAAVATFQPDTRYEIERRLSGLATKYARASAYLSRRMSGGKHGDAVKAQNQAARKVRQALGYTLADDKIHF